MAKIIIKIYNALTILILICILAIVGVLLIPRLAGYETFAALSGSMEPYYHVGSTVFVDKSVTPEEVKVGDPITFTRTDTLVAIRRVIDIDNDKREFRTKGDVSATEDVSLVSFDMLVGKAGMSAPLLGCISIRMKIPKGMLGVAAVFIVIILPQLIPEFVKPEKKKES